MKKHSLVKLVCAFAACFGAGAFGAVFTTRESITVWYAGLNRPSFTPPDWLFGPVWSVLYLLMAVSLYIVWDKADSSPAARKAVLLFWVQLILNAVWTPLFFGAHLILAAFIDIVLLWLAILATAAFFRRIAPTAAVLLVPYLIWVGYAAALNGAIWQMN